MTIRTSFIMIKNDVKPKALLQIYALLHALSKKASPLYQLQTEILKTLITERKEKKKKRGVEVTQFVLCKSKQDSADPETIKAWNNLASILACIVPKAILTDLP